jgi:hypothetical protein
VSLTGNFADYATRNHRCMESIKIHNCNQEANMFTRFAELAQNGADNAEAAQWAKVRRIAVFAIDYHYETSKLVLVSNLYYYY